MLPFEPETEEELRARYLAAMTRVYDVTGFFEMPADRPGLHREHVFDFEDGLRLIISREKRDKDVYLHWSASMEGADLCEESVTKFAEFVMGHMVMLWGSKCGAMRIMMFYSGRVLHFICPEGQKTVAEVTAAACPLVRGDPRLN